MDLFLNRKTAVVTGSARVLEKVLLKCLPRKDATLLFVPAMKAELKQHGTAVLPVVADLTNDSGIG